MDGNINVGKFKSILFLFKSITKLTIVKWNNSAIVSPSSHAEKTI